MEKKEILVSIVIPVYNSENTIGKCLDSLLNQTYKNIEIICVNDCSKDDSLRVLNDYSNKDNRIVVIDHKENLNAGGARNSGIRAAKGRYVCFVDNDDWLRDDAIELMIKASKNGAIDMVACYWCEAISDGTYKNHKNLVYGGSLEDNIRESLLNGARILGALISISLIVDNNLQYPEKTFWEDNAIGNAWLIAAKSIVVVDEVLYYYYVGNPQSSSKTLSLKSVHDRIHTTQICFDNCLRMDKNGIYIEEIKYRWLYLTNWTMSLICDFEKKEALNMLRDIMPYIDKCLPNKYMDRFSKEEFTMFSSPKKFVKGVYAQKRLNSIKKFIHKIRHSIVVVIKKIIGLDPNKSIYAK